MSLGVPPSRRKRTTPAAAGVSCPACCSLLSQVLDTRSHDLGIKRRRVCLSCSQRFNSLEMIIPEVDDSNRRVEIMALSALDVQGIQDATATLRRIFGAVEEATA